MEVLSKVIYKCPACYCEYTEKNDADKCLSAHLDRFNNNRPNYYVGCYVVMRRALHSNYEKEEITRVVNTKGNLFEQELLVENDLEERYWVNVCGHHDILSIKRNSFVFIPLSKKRAKLKRKNR